MLPNARLADLRFHDGAVDVDDEGNVDLVMNLVDLTQSVWTPVMVSVGLHRDWVAMCSSSKAYPAVTPSGVRYCTIDNPCEGWAVFMAKGISYDVQVFVKSGYTADYAREATSRVEEIVNSFS